MPIKILFKILSNVCGFSMTLFGIVIVFFGSSKSSAIAYIEK